MGNSSQEQIKASGESQLSERRYHLQHEVEKVPPHAPTPIQYKRRFAESTTGNPRGVHQRRGSSEQYKDALNGFTSRGLASSAPSGGGWNSVCQEKMDNIAKSGKCEESPRTAINIFEKLSKTFRIFFYSSVQTSILESSGAFLYITFQTFQNTNPIKLTSFLPNARISVLQTSHTK